MQPYTAVSLHPMLRLAPCTCTLWVGSRWTGEETVVEGPYEGTTNRGQGAEAGIYVRRQRDGTEFEAERRLCCSQHLACCLSPPVLAQLRAFLSRQMRAEKQPETDFSVSESSEHQPP